MAFCFYKQQILFLKINALEKGTYLFREKACKNLKKRKNGDYITIVILRAIKK